MSEQKHFAVCVENGDYAGTLELKKLYEIIDDPSAEKRSYVRVIDVTGKISIDAVEATHDMCP